MSPEENNGRNSTFQDACLPDPTTILPVPFIVVTYKSLMISLDTEIKFPLAFESLSVLPYSVLGSIPNGPGTML